MIPKFRLIFFILLCTCLSGCHSATPTPLSATPSSEFVETPIPTVTLAPSPTLLPRWLTYQQALAVKILDSTDALCEFELLGVSDSAREVYIWYLCKINRPKGASGSGAAVIHLNRNGEIEKIDTPISGVAYPDDVRQLFPPDIAERVINMDLLGYWSEDHLKARQTVSIPPLMIVAGTPLP